MISHIPYQYTDAGGFHQFGDIYLDAELENPRELGAIEDKLQDGEFFIPGQLNLGIPELQSLNEGFPSDLDHVFHILHLYGFEVLPAAPEGATVISAQAFKDSFAALAGPNSWDVVAAHHRLGL